MSTIPTLPLSANYPGHVRQTDLGKELLQSEALRDAVFNSTYIARIVTDANGVIQVFNVGAERLLGYSAVEVLNKVTPAVLFDPQELKVRAQAVTAEFGLPIEGFEAVGFRASRGLEDIFEMTFSCKDGTRLPAMVFVTSLRDAQNRIIGYLINVADDTARYQVEKERKYAQEAHRSSDAQYRTLFECAPDGILIPNAEGYYLDVNGSMCRMLGYSRDELIGLHASSIVAESQIEQIGPALKEIQATSNHHREWQFRRKDGSTFEADVIATMMPDGNLLAMVRDITERKLHERALQLKNIELEDSNRMKSEFLANMSHELRTPLNSIIGFSEVLRDGLVGETTEKQHGFIGDIFNSGKHLLSLINDILDLSKVEAGKMELDLEAIPISTLLANSISVIRETAAVHNIRIEMDIPDPLGVIQADARKIKQIIYNLLSNAVKFTGDGGQVKLRAVRVPLSEVGHLSGTWMGRSFPLHPGTSTEFIKISVTDNGIGISLAGMDRLFKAFSQIDSGLARRFEGTGLGLVMVKLLAELHDGTVAVESAQGEGSCFTVWLSLRIRQDEPRSSVRSPSTGTRNIMSGNPLALVVEEDHKSAELIRVHLEALGYEVLHAVSGEAAMALAQQQTVSLITLDVLLPNLEGWEFLSRLKKIPNLRHIPVVIISLAADPNKAFFVGAAAVLQKPVSRQDLYESLVDLGLFPAPKKKPLQVLVVDDDRKAVELIAAGILGPESSVLRAYGGREAIDMARMNLPDVMVLDLMMPDVNGFDVVTALNDYPDTARIPIVVVTAKDITAEDRAKLGRNVTAIMEKPGFNLDRFAAEVRRAISGHGQVA